MDVGSKIRKARKSKGFTQIKVAELAGIAVNSLRLYESGKRQPHIEQLQKIAHALQIDIYDLIDSGFGALDAVLPSNWQGVNLDHAKIDSKFLSVLLSNLTKLDRNSAVYLRSRNAIFALAESSGLSNMALNFIEEHEKLSEQSTIYFSNSQKLIEAFNQLNTEGQETAIDRVQELGKIPEYRRQDAAETAQEATEGKDTPAGEEPPKEPQEGGS